MSHTVLFSLTLLGIILLGTLCFVLQKGSFTSFWNLTMLTLELCRNVWTTEATMTVKGAIGVAPGVRVPQLISKLLSTLFTLEIAICSIHRNTAEFNGAQYRHYCQQPRLDSIPSDHQIIPDRTMQKQASLQILIHIPTDRLQSTACLFRNLIYDNES